MHNTLKKILLFLFGALNIAAVFYFWWTGSSHYYLTSGTLSGVEIAIGRLFGLCAELVILIQLILIGRIGFIEQLFGHDKMNRLHRINGYSLAFFIFFHPLLLILGYSSQNQTNFISQFFNFILTWQDVLKAFIAFLLFAAVIIIALPFIRKKVRYESWYFTHLLVYVAVILVFGHQINTADVSQGAGLYYWLTIIFGIGTLFVLYRFLRPLYSFFKHGFYIEKIVPETHDVNSVYIKGKHLGKFKFHAGQFANYTFLQQGMWYKHPFSFSSNYNGNYIRISVKGVGDFTKKIPTLKPGTKVIIDGPLGIFTEKSSKKDKYLFIAGGIGITPLRSLIESLSKKNKDVILLYGNKSAKDIAFKKELEDFSHRYHFVLSEVSDEKFEQGFIDAEKITRLAPDFRDREIYLCGPVPMMNSVIHILKKLGMPDRQVHFERFGY